MSAPKVHTTSKTDYFWVNFMENLEEKFSNNFIINFVARNWNPKLITHLWSSNRPDSDKNRLVNLAHLVPWRGFFEVIFWTRKFYRTFKIINFNFDHNSFWGFSARLFVGILVTFASLVKWSKWAGMIVDRASFESTQSKASHKYSHHLSVFGWYLRLWIF